MIEDIDQRLVADEIGHDKRFVSCDMTRADIKKEADIQRYLYSRS